MTTQITAIRDQIKTLVETALPSYRQIANPYEIEKSPNVILRLGYGIAFGPGTNTNRELGCQLSVDREFAVVLTREVTALENNPDGREDVEKALFEDHYSLIKAIEKDPDLGETAARARYVSDSGLEYVALDNSRYFVLVSSFACEYFESLT